MHVRTGLTTFQALEVCYKVGVRVVTVYAFSIENFKRSKFEVEALMDMAKVKLTQLAQHGELLERYGARMQFLGQRDMVRADVLEQVDKAIEMTRDNARYMTNHPSHTLQMLTSRHSAILNICAPYTSRDEITTAIRQTVIDYSEPLRPPLKRPFSESRIARHVRAQQLATVSEGDEKSQKLKDETAMPEIPRKDISKLDVFNEDKVNYKPSNPESEAVFGRMTTFVAQNVGDASEDLGSKSADSIIQVAADAILDVLKDPTLGDEDQLGSIADILDTDITREDFTELKDLAEEITDYTPPPDATPTDASGSTTVGQNSSPGTSFVPSSYPDPESITADTITSHTFTGSHTPPLDLLIRTSGVERLSDFMLWQCHQDTEIYFLQCLWPEFDLWHFLPVLLEWQWRKIREVKGDRTRMLEKAV